MLRDIVYFISEPGAHNFQLHTSANDNDLNGLVLHITSKNQMFFNITNLMTKETKNITGYGQFTTTFQKDSGFLSYNSDYNITLIKEDSDLFTILLRYTEIYPTSFAVLSDNEDYSVYIETTDLIYMTYHTPKYSINPSHKIEFHIHNIEIIEDIFISTNNFPDPTVSDSYIWHSNKEIITIDESDGNFCKNTYCVYYITIKPKDIGGFSILPACTFDFIAIPTDHHEESADIPPMSSSYGKIDLPIKDFENYNLEISFYYRKPSELSGNLTNVAIFVALVPTINPSTTLWHASTVTGSDGYLRISNSDPYFCMNCTYYIRLDGAPDVYFELDTRINTYITSEFAPVAIYPEDRVRGFLRGKSLQQKLNYKFFIPCDDEDDMTDTITLKLVQDVFVDENITAIVTNNHPDYPNPTCHDTSIWNITFDNSDTGVFYIIREMVGFCTNTSYILTITLNKAENRLQNFNLYFNYESGLIATNSTPKDSIIYPETKGRYFIYNRTLDYLDIPYYVKLNNKCNKTLILDLSLSSFRDGNDTYEWSYKYAANREGSNYLSQGNKLMLLTPYFYIHVHKEDPSDDERCPFAVYLVPNSYQEVIVAVHLGVQKFTYTKGREGYIYVTMDLTGVRNLNSAGLILTYSGDVKPISIYTSTTYPPKPQLGEYIMQSIVTGSPFLTVIRIGTPEFCPKCVYKYLIHFPSNFNGEYTLAADVVQLPTELKFGEEYSDMIERHSDSDYYILTFGNNPNKPRFYFNVTITSFVKMDYYVAISTDPNNKEPTKDNANWVDTSSLLAPISILIDSTNPAYCINCKYYITVGINVQVNDELKYKIYVDCIDGNCQSCPNHFTPESGCTECEEGYYGSSCSRECFCGHGICDEGVTGSGQCTCDPGWKGWYCTLCSDGYFGSNCDPCSVDCHDRGKCFDSSYGDGMCFCIFKYSRESNCSDCIYGYYEEYCSDLCPGAPENTCSGNGICNSGINGNGRCACNENYAGINCSTSIYLTKCKPPCDPIHGSCNEETGKCYCYDGYIGDLCQDLPAPETPAKQSSKMSGGIIALIVILVVVFIGVIIGVVINIILVKSKGKIIIIESIFLEEKDPTIT